AEDSIRFVLRNGHKDFIDFQNKNIGCWSWIGRQGGGQNLNLQTPSCTYYVGTAIHEINHAIGFWHEHTREDRDNYVSINWNNIQRDQQYNFNKAPQKQITYNVPYDYKSVMHYSEYAFAINPNVKTIMPTNPPDATIIGERSGLSNGDVLKINRMYEC
ncbi:PREDICTED: high choriolytic enzyme 2-like, partial [Wasmannia auropunctata]|uniref:high choriolytic enzyme 2-like n=1 Tax=Wasmannia auropunctata TaxID=64793 RepID=UPI0005ED6376